MKAGRSHKPNTEVFNTSEGFFGKPLDHEAPIVVCDCISFIRNRGMYQVGVFRIPGNMVKMNELKAAYDEEFNSPDKKVNNRKSVLNNSDATVNDVASLLKAFFKEIPGRLIPERTVFKLMEIAKADPPKDQQILAISAAVKEIPSPNRECLGLVISFLREVCNFKNFNQMGADNLATCFVLSLMGGDNAQNQMQVLGYGALVVRKLITLPIRLYMPSVSHVQANTRYIETEEQTGPANPLSSPGSSRSLHATLRSRPRKGTTLSTGNGKKGKTDMLKLRSAKAKKNKAIAPAQAFSALDSMNKPVVKDPFRDLVPPPLPPASKEPSRTISRKKKKPSRAYNLNGSVKPEF